MLSALNSNLRTHFTVSNLFLHSSLAFSLSFSLFFQIIAITYQVTVSQMINFPFPKNPILRLQATPVINTKKSRGASMYLFALTFDCQRICRAKYRANIVTVISSKLMMIAFRVKNLLTKNDDSGSCNYQVQFSFHSVQYLQTYVCNSSWLVSHFLSLDWKRYVGILPRGTT